MRNTALVSKGLKEKLEPAAVEAECGKAKTEVV